VKIIDVESHFYNPSYITHIRSRTEPPMEAFVDGELRIWQEPSSPDVWQQRSTAFEDVLCDMAERRLQVMDETGVDVHVLSLNVPGCEQFEPAEGARVARRSNDELAAVIARYPDRFVGLAALAPGEPGAPDELERCVRELGFRGAKINSHIGNTYLDHERYWPLLERAEALGVPIFLHPIVPHGNMSEPYSGLGWALVGPGLGFGHETAVSAMRVVLSGTFDRFPKLQFVLGHLGEGLYFWLYRLDFDFTKKWLSDEGKPKIQKRPSQYLRENFYVNTSGHFQPTSFAATLAEIGTGRMMFATDYPYEDTRQAIRMIEDASLSDDDKEKIFHGNAKRLLGI
jgi:predicted TIM-barrel fold metal-dependent hydrolase